jgi:hypothetical protein
VNVILSPGLARYILSLGPALLVVRPPLEEKSFITGAAWSKPLETNKIGKTILINPDFLMLLSSFFFTAPVPSQRSGWAWPAPFVSRELFLLFFYETRKLANRFTLLKEHLIFTSSTLLL